MSLYGDIMDGLKTVLEANVPGLRVYDYPPDSIQQFPAAALVAEPLDLAVAFKGNTFTASVRVVFLLTSGDDAKGAHSLYDFFDPIQTNKSLVAAVRADRTLNGKVDDADAMRIENIGRRELWGGWYWGFDMIIEFVKSVA